MFSILIKLINSSAGFQLLFFLCNYNNRNKSIKDSILKEETNMSTKQPIFIFCARDHHLCFDYIQYERLLFIGYS